MNENKRIDNPWIRVVKCVDALKMKTCLEGLQKQTVGLISNIKKFTVIEFCPYRQKKSFRYRTVANLPTFDFRLHQNRRQVASFPYAKLFCTGTWVRDKSFKKIVLIMVPWPKIDALRTFIFCEVSIVGKTPLGRKLQPPHLCGLKTIKSWIFHFSKQKKKYDRSSNLNFILLIIPKKFFFINWVINNWEKRCPESFIQSEPYDLCYQLFFYLFFL